LIKNDFTVIENQDQLDQADFEVQFANAIPLSVSIILDYSTSIFDSGVNTVLEDAAIEFIDQLSNSDAAEIIKFGTTVQVIQGFTSDKALLKAAVTAPFTPEPETEIYQALLKGLDDTAAQPDENRKAVIIITDGKQNPDPSPSGVTIDDVLVSANEKSIPIFPIGVGINIDVDSLTRLADESGGIFYQAIGAGDVDEIVQQLANTLIIDQYVFTYTSALTGSLPASLTIEAEFNGLTDSGTKEFTSCP
jgi:Ca-activated chloride channel family protein